MNLYRLTLLVLLSLELAACGGGSSAPPSNPTPPAAPLAVTTAVPFAGVVGDPYVFYTCQGATSASSLLCTQVFALTATGGVTPYSWTWAPAPGSSLPPGLGIKAGVIGYNNGIVSDPIQGTLISGTPTTAGTYKVVATVTDSQVPPKTSSAQYTFSITLPPAPVVSQPLTPFYAVNQPYQVELSAKGEGDPFTWTETGPLPTGLTISALSGSTGLISGTPTVVGSFPIQITAKDKYGQTSTPVDFTVQIYPHGFYATGSMAHPRSSGHTATLLPDGKVLVAGLPDIGVITAEVYDPVAGTFSTPGDMVDGRSGHGATLLNNGKVLLTGGFHFQILATAELFDPATETFSSTNGPMATARSVHTSTLLNDGRLLVAGGTDESNNAISKAELFDPVAGTFSPTGDLIAARTGHTATLLNDGRVLLAGGQSPGVVSSPIPDAQIYDPVAATFSAAGNMVTARVGHTATLLPNGKVLIVGGQGDAASPLATAELFDPATNSFTAVTAVMETGRTTHTATLLNDGTVLIAGGDLQSLEILFHPTSAEIFDPATAKFVSTGGQLTSDRYNHTATLLQSGHVLLTGGTGTITEQGGTVTSGATFTAEIYE
jgi:hypothetical protein